MTTKKRHTPEQVVRKLTQADRLLGEGKDVADVYRELQVWEQTCYRWRNQFATQATTRLVSCCGAPPEARRQPIDQAGNHGQMRIAILRPV